MAQILSTFLENQRLQSIAPYMCGRVLDLGCNNARAIELLQSGQSYVGVDRNSAMLEEVRRQHPHYEFLPCDFDKEPLDLGTRVFDTILMVAVIEHLENPDKILGQLSAHLAPNGKLLITTPTPWGDTIHGWGAKWGLFSQAAAEEHEIIFNYKTLNGYLSPHGFKIVTYKRFLLGGNQLFICERANLN